MRHFGFIVILLFCCCTNKLAAQQNLINPFNVFINQYPVTFIDLDKDGDPDVLRTFINDSIPIQWIDDDDDMMKSDLQGDLNNDCLMIDRNKDGKYADELDLIVDWVDEDGDGKADLQIIADNARRIDRGWTPGHFMITIDTDNDGVFNYINWQTLQLEAWDHEGRSRFYQDYSGKSMFMKIHTSVFNMDDPRYNWENPFLFYDEDEDGLTEMAIRLVDAPLVNVTNNYGVSMSRQITDVRMSFDLDNDNASGNEFDFDLSLKFTGKGFDYSRYVHKFKKLRGLPESDTFFYDPRWRQMTELIYVDHEQAYEAVMKKGNWTECWLTVDEDDDCERWERVEFYEPKDIFKIGARNGGLDNNPQADASGDRGEWDMDNSGKGKLYVSKLDGKIHLYGAEWGAWRIDQNAKYYQGWQGWRNGADSIPHDEFDKEPEIFPTIKYTDTDGNGFFDQLQYDWDGDKAFERIVSLKDFGIDDSATLIDISSMGYSGYQQLFQQSANQNWTTATNAIEVAAKFKLNTAWYAYLLYPKSLQEKYHHGYWLNLFIYEDLRTLLTRQSDTEVLKKLDLAYHSGNWNTLLQ
jgi:hypothetical protein